MKTKIFDYFLSVITFMGTIVILGSAVVHLQNLDLEIIGLWGFAFQIALIIIVFDFGFKWLFRWGEDLKETLKK